MAFGNNPYYVPQYYTPQSLPQYYTPQMPAQQAQQMGGITWVQGEAGAKAYNVRPGESAFLMDSEAPMAYLKSADMTGMPSMRYYSVTELSGDKLPGAAPAQETNYATQDDLQKMQDELQKLRKSIKALKSSMEVHDDE